MECFGFQNGLMGMEEEIIPYFCNISDPDPGIYYGRNSSGRIPGYTGCAEFLADERAASGNTERFPRRSICYHFMYRLFSDVYWRVFLSECTEYGSDRI